MKRIYKWKNFRVGDYMLGLYPHRDNGVIVEYKNILWKLTKINKKGYKGNILASNHISWTEDKNSFLAAWGFNTVIYFKLTPDESMVELL